jgi:hypothetical protein
MSFHHTVIGVSILSTFSMLGCGRGTGATDDPLAGTWRNDACFGSSSKPADVERCAVALTFTNGLGVELEAKWISLAATAMNPGCTTTRRVTGQKWSTNHATQTLTVTGTGNATIERSHCVNAEDKSDAIPTSDIEIRPGDMSYELDDGTLRVFTGDLRGTYSR